MNLKKLAKMRAKWEVQGRPKAFNSSRFVYSLKGLFRISE